MRRSKDFQAPNEQGQDLGVKLEEAHSQKQGIGTGRGTSTSVEREIVGQDHREKDDEEEEQRDVVPEEQGTKPRPKCPQPVILDQQGFQRETSDEVNHQRDLDTWH